MGTLLTLIGIAAAVVGLWDMHHSLLHPSGTGPLGGRVQSGVWAVSRLGGHRLGFAVGPAAMVAAVALWVSLQTAALTWFTQVHRPLSRRRTLALELKSLADVAYAEDHGRRARRPEGGE